MNDIVVDKSHTQLCMSDGDRELFDRIHRIIVEKQLFLDPAFSRNTYIRLSLLNKNKVAGMLRKYAGTNLNGYINAMRLEYAVRLLREDSLAPVKAIAANSGFRSIRTFYRLFALKYGMSPVEYREKLCYIEIAGWNMQVDCGDEVIRELPNYRPFLVSGSAVCDDRLLCRVQVGCELSPETSEPHLVNRLVGRDLRLWLMPDHCSVSLTLLETGHTWWLRADREWRHVVTNWHPDTSGSYFILDDFLMIAFIYSSAFRDTVLIHASCVAVGQSGCAFIGPSGIGKSTHARLWLEHIPGSRLLNDDQPVLRRMADGSMRIYGSPWSGKTPCYRNEGVRLCTLFFMEQAGENQAIRLNGVPVFCRLLEAVSAIGRDAMTFASVTDTLAEVAGVIPAYLLKNRPERAAALLSSDLFFNNLFTK